MSAYGGPSIVNSNLALHLDAGNPKSYPGSGSIWTDLSGNNRHGTLQYNATYNSAYGGNIYLDGTGDHVSVTNCLGLKWQNITQISYEVVFSTPGRYTGNSRQYIFESRNSNGTPTYNWFLFVIDNNSYITTGTGRNTSGSYSEFNITMPSLLLNKIWHVSQTIDKTQTTNNFKTYINGTLVDTRSYNNNTGDQGSDTGDNFFLGTYWGGLDNSTNFHLLGSIYMCKVYNRALSATEVTQNFNAVRGRYGL